MIRAIALVDLDDTLFQTLRKCPPDVAEERLVPLGFARDGSALSFATPRQVAFVEWLAETALLIPVTARSLDALRRVRVPFAAAVCAHGGVILDEASEVDAAWHARINALAARAAPVLDALAAAITAEATRLGTALSVRVLTEGDTPLYVLVKHPEADDAALAAIVAAAVPALPPGWCRHINGNNIALLPPWLGKAHAVAHLLPALRARHPDLPVIGIGDSRTDAAFMRLCDFAMMPTGAQLTEMALRDA
jgi:hypothetical protein